MRTSTSMATIIQDMFMERPASMMTTYVVSFIMVGVQVFIVSRTIMIMARKSRSRMGTVTRPTLTRQTLRHSLCADTPAQTPMHESPSHFPKAAPPHKWEHIMVARINTLLL